MLIRPRSNFLPGFSLLDSACKCKDLTSLEGLFGNCRLFEYGKTERGKRYCYVDEPATTSCSDAKNSSSIYLLGEKYSEKACNGKLLNSRFNFG